MAHSFFVAVVVSETLAKCWLSFCEPDSLGVAGREKKRKKWRTCLVSNVIYTCRAHITSCTARLPQTASYKHQKRDSLERKGLGGKQRGGTEGDERQKGRESKWKLHTKLCKASGMKHRFPHKMIMLLNEIWQYSCKRLIQGSPAAMQM